MPIGTDLGRYEPEVFYMRWSDESIMRASESSLEPTSEELAAEGGREPRHLVRLVVHIRVYHVAILDYQGYLRITVALRKEQNSQHLPVLAREPLTF